MCQAAEGCAQAVTSSGRCLRWPSWTGCETSWAAGPLRIWLGPSPCPARKASSYYIAMNEMPLREGTIILEPALRMDLELRNARYRSYCKPASSVPMIPSPLKGCMDMDLKAGLCRSSVTSKQYFCLITHRDRKSAYPCVPCNMLYMMEMRRGAQMLPHRHVRFNRGQTKYQRRLPPGAEPPQPNFPRSSRRPCLACCRYSSPWRHIRLMAGPCVNANSSAYTLLSLFCSMVSLSISFEAVAKI